MRKRIHLILLFAIFILMFKSNSIFATTNEISNISIDVIIDEIGNANITEIWTSSMYDGTEMYKSYTNLNNSRIEDLSVTDESNTKYEYLSTWNLNASRDNKKYKCGINSINNGIELCWGIGDYGTHTYTLNYTIKNFVSNYNDYQLVEFKFIPAEMNPVPKSINITISAPFDLTDYIVSANGIGFSGTTDITDGKIIISISNLNSTEYVTLNAKFKDTTFDIFDLTSDTNNINNTTNNDLTNSNSNDDSNKSNNKIFLYVIITIFALIIIIVAILIAKRRKEIKEEKDKNNTIYTN